MTPISEDDENIEPSDTPKKASEAKEKRHIGLRGRWKLTSTVNKMIAIATIVSAVSTFTYAVFTYLQWRVLSEQIAEIKKGSTDTHDLAIAAKKQSEQAEAQTKKMAESLTRTDKLIGATSDLAKEAKRSADISQSAVNAARKNLALAERSLHIQERPYIGVKRITVTGIDTGDFKATVDMTNAGKTPALDYHFSVFIALTQFVIPDNPPDPAINVMGSVFTLVGGENVRSGEVHIDAAENLADINNGKLFVYVFGRFTYKDVFNCKHEGRFCSVYLPKFKFFTTCPNNNLELEEVCK